MSVEISTRVLPGIGVCQEVALSGGGRLGIVTRRSGLRDLVVYDADGDGAADSVELTDAEANAIAELLGAPKLISALAELQGRAEQLVVEQLPIPVDSPYAGGTLGQTQARTRTGASIVAVIRAGLAHASPTPDYPLLAGDLVITVGTRQGVDALARLLDGSVGEAAPPGHGTPVAG